MAGGSRVSVLKEFHKLLQAADKLYDGQVEFVTDEGEDEDDVTEKDVEDDVTEKDAEDDVTEGNTENVVNENFDAYFFITPKDGLYKNARMKFHMRVNLSKYPDKAPEIFCINSVFHPNIYVDVDGNDEEYEGRVCVSLLTYFWEPGVRLDGAVMAVLYLFYHPYLYDCINNACQSFDDFDEYAACVKPSLRGERIAGFPFDKLLDDETDYEGNEEVEADTTTTTTAASTTTATSISTTTATATSTTTATATSTSTANDISTTTATATSTTTANDISTATATATSTATATATTTAAANC